MPPRVVAIADSDSYLKWSRSLLAQLPADWSSEQWVVASPITPSSAQIHAATDDPDLEPAGFPRLYARLLATRPDVVLLACTGPVVQAFMEYPYLRSRGRPVLVTGLPGISLPSSPRAVRFRSGLDLMVLHSQAERREFIALAQLWGEQMEFALTRLPFLRTGPVKPVTAHGRAVIFASQAKVPADAEQRTAILQALAEVPADLSPVVKVRALAGERQTHHEAHSYADLHDRLLAQGRLGSARIEFVGGSMTAALQRAAGFVTVSSTAALEALAEGVPSLVLSDFGVSEEMINLVFTGSGLLGTLDDLRDGRFRSADPRWLAENYFHDESQNDFVPRLTALVRQRQRGPLPRRIFRPLGRYRGRLRRHARVLLPSLMQRFAG